MSSFEEDSDIEISFIEYLEKCKKVKWWFKNGSQDGSYFAVPYKENKNALLLINKSDKEKYEALSAADIFIAPSHYEGFGIIAISVSVKSLVSFVF